MSNLVLACHCGDGSVNTVYEECDWGTLNGFLCWASYGETCNYCSSLCKLKTIFGGYCGDGVINPCYEECDDGNTEDGDGCSSECEIEPECPEDYDCDTIKDSDDNCKFVWNPNQLDSDGDGKGDMCDPSPFGYCGDGLCIGDEDYLNCPEDCSVEPFCGDGIINKDEECDNGELNGILCDNTTSSCTYCSSECESITLPYATTQPQSTKKSSPHKNHFVQFCDVNWECSGWGGCIDGLMTRQCYDKNYCEDSYNKPLEKTGCEIISQVLVKEDELNYPFILVGITFVILIGILTGLIIVRRLKK